MSLHLRRIKETREDSDLRQEDIANELGVPKKTYKNWEEGYRDFPLDMLVKYADILNISLDYLAERTNNKKVNK